MESLLSARRIVILILELILLSFLIILVRQVAYVTCAPRSELMALVYFSKWIKRNAYNACFDRIKSHVINVY